MVIKVEGELVSWHTSGFGPFRRRVAETEPFSCLIVNPAEPVEVLEDFSVEYVETPYGAVVQGELKGISCMFGEFRTQGARSFSFTMLSVSGYELRGTVSIAEPKAGPRSRSAG